MASLTIQETSRNILYAPYYLAIELLKSDPRAPAIRLITAPNTTSTIGAIVSGEADVTIGGLSRAEKEFDLDPANDLVSFGMGVHRDPAFLVANTPQPGFELRHLAGRRVGMPSRHKPAHMFLRHDLAQIGITDRDLDWVHTPDDAIAAAMLDAGTLDYAHTNSPLPPRDGPWHIVQSAAARGPTAYAVLFALRSRLPALRPAVERYLAALGEAERLIATRGRRVVLDELRSFFPSISEKMEAASELYERFRIWSPTPVIDRVAYDAVADPLLSNGYVATKRPYEVAVDNSLSGRAA